MVTTGEETEEQESGLYNLFAIGAKATPPYTEVVNVNGKNLSLVYLSISSVEILIQRMRHLHNPRMFIYLSKTHTTPFLKRIRGNSLVFLSRSCSI